MRVVIIGAGVAGLAIGWRLMQKGASVTVLDRAQPGRGATWAAAGMIAATMESTREASPIATSRGIPTTTKISGMQQRQ